MFRCLLLLLLATPLSLVGQDWVPGSSLPLVQRAMQQRDARDADTALASWRAIAHGTVLSTTVLTRGDLQIERPVKRDELTVEVYGEIPNRSKQVIQSWRDTSYLPNRIRYHRDHLGIVANDFGETIRLGDGDEVRNLIHPLSKKGMDWYLFREGPVTTIASQTGLLTVMQVEVRPRDPRSPGTVGTLYLDVDRAVLVRFRFTFTPESYLDRTVQDITVVLESSLLDQTRWLPWRQSIVIRRADPRIELPSYSVIKASWVLDDYQLGVTIPPGTFDGIPLSGPPVAPPPPANAPPIPETPAGPPEDVTADEIQKAASAMLGGRSLSGLPAVRTAITGFSDLLSVNRAGGLIVSYGLRFPVGPTVVGRARAGVAFGSGQLLGSLSLSPAGRSGFSLSAQRLQQDIADFPISSSLYNTIVTSISGNDHGDWTLVEGATASFRKASGRSSLSLDLSQEWSRSLNTTFEPVGKEARPNPALGIGSATVLRGRLGRESEQSKLDLRLEAGSGAMDWLRASGQASLDLGRIELRTQAGWGSRDLPGYRSFALGGSNTLPGLPYRAIGGRSIVLGELGWKLPVNVPLPWSLLPAPPGMRQPPLPTTLTPFLAAGKAWGDMADLPWRGGGQLEPVAGIRIDLWGRLLRFETGVSLRHGGWGFTFDLHPDWWGAM